MREGLVGLPLPGEEDAEIVVRLGVVGVGGEGGAVVGDGLSRPALAGEEDGEVFLRAGKEGRAATAFSYWARASASLPWRSSRTPMLLYASARPPWEARAAW